MVWWDKLANLFSFKVQTGTEDSRAQLECRPAEPHPSGGVWPRHQSQLVPGGEVTGHRNKVLLVLECAGVQANLLAVWDKTEIKISFAAV